MKNKKQKKLFIEHDFTSDLLPQTRRAQFFDILKIRYGTLLKIGLIILLCTLPLLIKSYLVGSYNDAITLNINSGSISETDGEGARKILIIISCLINLALYPLVFLSFTGSIRILRQLCYSEGILFRLDFKKGMKDNVLYYLFAGFLLAFFELISIVLLLFFPMTFMAIFALVFFFLIVLPVLWISLFYSSVYKNNIWRTLYHSFFVYLKSNWKSLIYIGVMAAPIVGLEFGANLPLIKQLIYAFMIVFIYPAGFLAGSELYLNEFDRAFNLVHCPELVRKGLYISPSDRKQLFQNKEDVLDRWQKAEEISENKTPKKIIFEILMAYDVELKDVKRIKRFITSFSKESYLITLTHSTLLLCQANDETYFQNLNRFSSFLSGYELKKTKDGSLFYSKESSWVMVFLPEVVHFVSGQHELKSLSSSLAFVSDYLAKESGETFAYGPKELSFILPEIPEEKKDNEEVKYYEKKLNDLLIDQAETVNRYQGYAKKKWIISHYTLSDFLYNETHQLVTPFALPELSVNSSGMAYASLLLPYLLALNPDEEVSAVLALLTPYVSPEEKEEVLISLKALLVSSLLSHFKDYLEEKNTYRLHQLSDHLTYLDNEYDLLSRL